MKGCHYVTVVGPGRCARENAELYRSRCSLPALVQILSEQDSSADPADIAAANCDGRPFESFAFVAAAGCIACLRSSHEYAVSIRHVRAWPVEPSPPADGRQ